jgi:putative salt-induced outer membrane protein YdiY
MVIARRRTRLTRPARVLLGALFIATCHVTAFAQGMDVVKVKNGDQFTGDVASLERGDLSFGTAAAGTIDIAWSQVVTLSSKRILDVDTVSGMRYTGTISSPADGQLVVQTATGPTKPIPLSEVVRMRSVGETFFARTTGSVDFGLTVTNSTVTYALEGNANNRTRSYETDLTIESFLSQQDEGVTETRNNVEFDTRKLFVNRWFIVGTAQYQQDDELELDWRTVFGGGVGRVLVETPATLLQTEGGIDYNAESFTSALETDHSAEVFGAVDWDWSPTGPTEASINAKTEISLERARVRLEFDARLRRDIFWNLYWSVNAFDDFDSDPPDDRPKSAFGLAIGFGWSF